jgi:hypothetical protein
MFLLEGSWVRAERLGRSSSWVGVPLDVGPKLLLVNLRPY